MPKKKTKNRILTQMEFYLGDSNLRRDRFLREKISDCVPLALTGDVSTVGERRLGLNLTDFLLFNNIKALTDNVEDIRDSLVDSTLLDTFQAQAGDNSAWFVARKDWQGQEKLIGFLGSLDGSNQEFDKRTIYCENLPINASQQWLRKIFSQFGQINLVSMPRFKANQRIKQFCFIEFAEEETLLTALEFFRNFNGVLCYDETTSDHLQSIQKFHEEHQKETNSDLAAEATAPKRHKNCDVGDPAPTELQEEVEAEGEAKSVSSELNDNMIYDLKIMPKVDWKRLRNKYLNLQREMVREMKKQAHFRRLHTGTRNPVAPVAPVAQPIALQDNNSGEVATTQSKRRKRGREKVKLAIKKGSHIFFDA